MNRSTQLRALVIAAVAAIGMSSSLSLAQPAAGEPTPPPTNADGAPPVPPAPATTALEGTVKSMNVGPNGEYESLLLDVGDSRTTQVNFPPSIADSIGRVAAVGDRVKLTAEPTRSMRDHPVYELVSITGKDGKTMSISRPGDEKPGHVEGTIRALNYARDGRVNGAMLDSNTFVHVGPEAAEQLKLAQGQKVVADGIQRVSFAGRTVIDANNVNGTTIAHPAPPKPGPRDGPREGDPKPRPDRDDRPAPHSPPRG